MVVRSRSGSIGAADAMPQRRRIVDIVLDEKSVARRTPEVEHERAVALFDLLEENDFALVGCEPGPYKLHVGIFEQRLVFAVALFDLLEENDFALVGCEPGPYKLHVGIFEQ